MSYRVQCSGCGKVMTLEEDAAGERLVCVACGARLEAPPPPIVQAAQAPAGDAPPAPEVAWQPNPARVGAKAPRTGGISRTTLLTAAAVSFAIIAVAALVVVALLSRDRGGARQPGDRTVTSAEMRANADLLALKSEAEAMAIEGKLEESHAKYRKLQELAVGRDIKDPLLWDIMERAKLDQDNVYMLLLRKQIPPGENPGAAYTIPPYAMPGTPGNPPVPSTGPGGAQAQAQATQNETAKAVGTGEGAGTAPETQVAGSAPDEPETQPIAASQPNMPTLVSHAPPPESVTDEQIDAAMKRGVDYLLAQIKDGQVAEQPGVTGVKQEGMNALVVYCLLTSGQAMKDPRLDIRGDFMKGLLEKLKSYQLKVRKGEAQQPITYARSLRASALAYYNRPEDKKVLKEDVDWLVAAAVAGAYTYDDQFTRGGTARAIQDASDPQANAEDGSSGLAAPLAGRSGVAELAEWMNLRYGPRDERPASGTPHPAGTGAPVRFADLNESNDAQVFLMHGIHDANGRELYVPMGGPRITPLPSGYPPRPDRTQPPGLGRPPGATGLPPGAYGQRRYAPVMPGETPGREPGREGAGGSMSSAFPWDNSNSQYGLLGVWAGAEVGVEVPVRYWRDVEKHWTQAQLSGGEWGYIARDRAGSFAMTCGGIASLFVTHDWLVAPTVKDTGRDPLTAPLAAGLKWLERGDNAINTPNPKTHYVGYDLFGVERVALASGFKYFGKHDWYRELGANALGTQWPTGAWGREPDGPDAIVDTAYTLLFLARGRYPILMNKLRFERSEATRLDGKPAPGYWANRPRDLANLSRFASRQLERGINWQVVSLEAPWHDWLDSPVLYIASHQAPALEPKDYANLRQYVEGGGMIFTHADTGSPGFNRWVNKLVEQVCPGRKLEDLPEDHVLYSVNYKLRAPRPRLQGVSNGARLLLVHSPTDLSMQWQQRGEKVAPETFRLGLNLFLYAAGKTELRNRLETPYVREAKGEGMGKVEVARIRYDGNWDPEPGAWGRFGRLFQWQTNFGVGTTPVALKDLKAGDAPVAHLTGTAAVTFSDEDVAAAKAFVEAGGVLLVDVCGGSKAFYESVRDGLLEKAFPGAKPDKPPDDHPILRPAGEKESLVPKLRAYTAEAMKEGAPSLGVMQAGKGHVVVSPLDLTEGLIGANTWGVIGYDPATAQAIVRNVLMWAHTTAAPRAQ
jgi:hypothetical protein